MKTIFSVLFFSFQLICSFAQEKSFSITVVPNNSTLTGRGAFDILGKPLKGSTFVKSGNIYSGDYFENNCPDLKDCGLNLVLNTDTFYVIAEHDSLIIGRWDTRSFATKNFTEYLDQGGNLSFSTYTFTFKEDFEYCPGCLIVCEGKDFYGADENEYFKKAIVGGTTNEYRLMKGEIDQIIFKKNENESGAHNFEVTFLFDIE